MWFLFCLICVRMLLYGYLKFNENFKTNIILNIFLTSIISLIGVQIGQLYKLPWSFDIALVAFYIAYIGYLFKFYNIFDKIKYPLLLFLITILSSYIDYKYFGLSMNNRFYSSNPIISNYLIRLIPYCFLHIQHNNKIDYPNRLFTSIKKMIDSSLTNEDDLNELIPELYYLSELFFNKNEINFGKIKEEEVNNIKVCFKDEDPILKYEYISNLKSILESEETKLKEWISLIFGGKIRIIMDYLLKI